MITGAALPKKGYVYLRKQLTGDVTSRLEILRRSIEKQKWCAPGSIGSLVPSKGTVLLGPGADICGLEALAVFDFFEGEFF